MNHFYMIYNNFGILHNFVTQYVVYCVVFVSIQKYMPLLLLKQKNDEIFVKEAINKQTRNQV